MRLRQSTSVGPLSRPQRPRTPVTNPKRAPGLGTSPRTLTIQQPPQLANDILGVAWLGQDTGNAGAPDPIGVIEVLGIAGDGEDRNLGSARRCLKGVAEFKAVHARHHEIGQHRVRLKLMCLFESLKSVVCLDGAES